MLILLQVYSLAQSKEDSISLNTSKGIIQGSLFTPAGKSSYPVLLLIAGSGPTDRYGNNPMGVAANSYKMIAEALANENIGVLNTKFGCILLHQVIIVFLR